MILGLTFGTSWLLLGLLATLIPLALHLLARSRAQEVMFPTLRFLRMSMEKTSRRRRVQHVMLMLLRMLLLLLLAISVAEPISDAAGGFLGGPNYAAVLVLDNSMSMGVTGAGGTRLEKAKVEMKNLLSGDGKPAMAALMTTNDGMVSTELTARLEGIRDGVDQAPLGGGRAALAQRLAAAAEMLQKEKSFRQKSICLFTDMQKVSLDELAGLDALNKAEDVHLLVVNLADRQPSNVGVTDVSISGHRVVDQVLEITATLVNSSPTDKVVDVGVRVNGQPVGQKVRKSLRAAGKDGATAAVRFFHTFPQSGWAKGEIYIEQGDDLMADNIRRFCLWIGGRVKATIVRGPNESKLTIMDPGAMLGVALAPYTDNAPWSITPATVDSESFEPASVVASDVVFLCDVPSFTKDQTDALANFVAGGGTVVFFLGPNVKADNYNDRFLKQISAEGGLLPASIGPAIGEVGTTAAAISVDWVEVSHPYLKGLYENPQDYLGVQVQRYYQLKASSRPGQPLMRLKNQDPLMLVKSFGKGRVLLCATTASPQWSNLPATALFLPMMARVSLLARQEFAHDENYASDAQVEIRPNGIPADAEPNLSILVALPAGPDGNARSVTLPLTKAAEGYLATCTDTAKLGFYDWKVKWSGDKDISGSFAVNPQGVESQLESYSPDAFKTLMAKRGDSRVYIGATLAAAQQSAAAAAEGRNWWDLLIALVIVLLVVEAVVANRFKKTVENLLPGQAGAKAGGATASGAPKVIVESR